MRLVGTLLAQGAFAVQAYPSVAVDEREGQLNAEVEITAFGTAPTFKFQGSHDPTTVSDANSDWFDLEADPLASDAEAVSHSPGAAGVFGYVIRDLPAKVRINVSVTGACSGNAEAYQ